MDELSARYFKQIMKIIKNVLINKENEQIINFLAKAAILFIYSQNSI